jgi:hypothetical protein
MGTLLSFSALCAVIFLTDPIDIGNVAFIFFYVTFFLTVSGMSILILTSLWRRIAKDVATLGEIGMAIRQGILLGLLLTVIVGMQQLRILVWWDALLVVCAFFLIELYFLTHKK